MKRIVTNPVKLPVLLMLVLLQACGTSPSTAPSSSTAAVFDQGAYDSALSLMQDRKFEKAAVKLEELSRTDARRAGPYINLGIAYRQLGKLDEAKQALRIATERKGGNAIAWNELGIVYRKLGEFENAREAYRKSIRKQASYGKAYLNLGILCDIYLEDLSCALRNYEKYQRVVDTPDKKVALWLVDVRNRAGKSARSKQ
jgi:Flp pilus assembly protein TadD